MASPDTRRPPRVRCFVRPILKYIEWVIANARKFEEVELAVKGGTDEELAASLVAEMLRTGLTAKG